MIFHERELIQMSKTLAFFMALGSAAAAFAAPVSCYENEVTNARQCYETNNVREKNGIRFSPLYTGGPNGVTKTSFTIHVNCKTNVVHLKDRDGVSFAGGDGNETDALRHLRRWICQEKLRK